MKFLKSTLLCSLKNHGVDGEVSSMFEMGAETMALPLEEKMKFEQGDGGSSFGYVPNFQFDCAAQHQSHYMLTYVDI